MYTELINYIYEYCNNFKNELEKQAAKHYVASIGFSDKKDSPNYQNFFDKDLSNNPEVLKLLEDGFFAFKMKTAERIFRDHQHELKLNLCPVCERVARTPKARQCRFCGHDWH